MEYYFNTNDEVKCQNIFVENNEENINIISGHYLVIKKVDEDTLILKDNDKVNKNIYIVKLSIYIIKITTKKKTKKMNEIENQLKQIEIQIKLGIKQKAINSNYGTLLIESIRNIKTKEDVKRK
jgi:hypothetical protein